MSDTCTADRLIKSIETITPLIEADKLAFDQTRQITPPVVSAMHDVGLFSLWLPRELNGPALNLTDTTRVLEALAQIDGAPAWCAGIATTYSRLGAFLPRETARRILLMSVRSSLVRFPVDRLRRQTMATLCLGACHSQVGSAIVPGPSAAL